MGNNRNKLIRVIETSIKRQEKQMKLDMHGCADRHSQCQIQIAGNLRQVRWSDIRFSAVTKQTGSHKHLSSKKKFVFEWHNRLAAEKKKLICRFHAIFKYQHRNEKKRLIGKKIVKWSQLPRSLSLLLQSIRSTEATRHKQMETDTDKHVDAYYSNKRIAKDTINCFRA